MKRILLVDDDPVVLRLYQQGLSQIGVQVQTAANGASAINSLRTGKPDVVVLDLMMPSLTGVDVLKFIRGDAGLKSLPVVVLSNSYMNGLAMEATALGVQKALLKIRCSPSILLQAVDEVLERKSAGKEPLKAPAVPRRAPPPPATSTADNAGSAKPPMRRQGEAEDAEAGFHTEARRAFLGNARATCAGLRGLCQAVVTAAGETGRSLRLQSLYTEVHNIAAAAGLAECHQIAQMASVFEAMLFELIRMPDAFSPSVLRTIAATVDFMILLFDCAQDAELDVPLSARALVVDNEVANSRVMAAALELAHVETVTVDEVPLALQELEKRHYDLVLADVEMPTMGGFELSRRVRKLPGYKKSAIVHVTGASDFETRAKSVLNGGDDIISKPVFPLELTVKAVTQLLKHQIST